MDRWAGRVALVTGASVGIGAAICRELVKHGMTVVGCARNVDAIQDIAGEDELKGAAGKLVPMKCDLTKEEDILNLFEDIKNSLGRLDVCINNAGLSHDASLLTGTTKEWRNMLDVNVLGLCISSREAVKLMQEKNVEEGHIIHISSIGGHRLPSNYGGGAFFYCGTKFMVRALTEGLRRELKAQDSRIRISSISPGIVETNFMVNYLKDDPLKRPEHYYDSLQCLTPKDIADSVIYVLSAPQHVEVHDIIMRPYEQNT